jgi:uncharacterized protein (DUF305 family)
MKSKRALFAVLFTITAFIHSGTVFSHLDGHRHTRNDYSYGYLQRTFPSVLPTRTAMGRMHRAMETTKFTGDPDLDFARQMLPHHQGALDMIEILDQYGQDPQMRELADWMKTMQEQEVGFMTQWLDVRDGHDNALIVDPNHAAIKEMQAINHRMHDTMDIQFTGNPDIDFVRGMIPHHQAAVDMAWVVLRHGNNGQLNDIARDIIRSQTQEIEIMRDWLKAHDVTEAPAKPKKRKHKKHKQPHINKMPVVIPKS